MSDVFDEMRVEMVKKVPLLKNQPWRIRFKGFFAHESRVFTEERVGKIISTQYSQSAVIVEIDGKEYIKRWGFIE